MGPILRGLVLSMPARYQYFKDKTICILMALRQSAAELEIRKDSDHPGRRLSMSLLIELAHWAGSP